MSGDLRKRLIIVAAVIAGCVACLFPINKRINLGLDLRGGMHLVLRVENDKLPNAKAKEDVMLKAMEVLRNRIDGLGVGETVLQRQGANQILLELPGVTDRKKALAMVGRVAHLEFHLVSSDNDLLKQALGGHVPDGYELKHVKKEDNGPILISKQVALNGDAIKEAHVDFDSSGMQPKISLSFNDKGTKEFADLTTAHVGERLAIILDGEVLSAPNIKEPILSGDAEITGDFKFEEASLLALALRTGALPVPMHVEEERTIGPLLGKDSIEAGIKATILGGVLIVLFMSIYYFVGGFIASLALVVNLLMVFGGMGLINILLPDSQMTLTLPGIAGIILTLGMAVDANVLINERVREEIENGRPLGAAINTGYGRALSAIIDSHVTSLIAACMLFQFGSGPIKGFAVTLSIGLIASLFTSIYVTRTLFNFLTEKKLVKALPMMHVFRKPNFNFLNKKYFCFAFSAVLLVWGMVNLAVKKDSAYGIDFVGGQIQEFKFNKPVSADKLRGLFDAAGMKHVVIQSFANAPSTVILHTPEGEKNYDQVTAVFQQNLPNNSFQVMRVERVGPVVGKSLRIKAMEAIALALLGMLVYVGIRFRHYDFAAAAVLAIFHDVLITLGLIVLLGRQVDLLVVTALMTIAGYSINDSIIIYDRVRENVPKSRGRPLADVINDSINQTLGRTVLTTSVTLLSVLALYLVGGEVLNTFALVLILGFIFGTYSTVYVVSPLFLMWHGKKKW